MNSTTICLRSEIGFHFKEEHGKVITLDEGNSEEGCIHVDNVVEKLNHIYEQKMKENIDIVKCKYFKAISKYFELHLKQICDERQAHLEKLYFVFIMPNEWSAKTNMAELVLTPLLSNIGVLFSQDTSDRILCITHLCAMLSYLQLQPFKKQESLTFLQNENHCILYTIEITDKMMQQESIYFQIKQNYDLEIYYGDRFYIPKIISIHKYPQNDCIFDFDEVRNGLRQLLSDELVDVDDLLDTPLQDGFYTRINKYKTVADVIISQLLDMTQVSACTYPNNEAKHVFRCT